MEEASIPYLYHMKTKHLRRIIILGTLVMSGLLLVQLYWFRKAFDASDKQFDHTIQIALMRVADSVARNPAVKKLSSNFFFCRHGKSPGQSGARTGPAAGI